MVQKKPKDSLIDPVKKSARVPVKKVARKKVGIKKNTSSSFSVPISDLSNATGGASYSTSRPTVESKVGEQKIPSSQNEGVLQVSSESSNTQTPSISQSVFPHRTGEIVRKLKVISFRPRVPKITRGRMRLVAYIGVAYVVAGVCTGSYALANMHKDDFLAGTVLQTASALLGASSLDSLLVTTTSSGGPDASGQSGSNTSESGTSGTSGTSAPSNTSSVAATSTPGSGDTVHTGAATVSTTSTLPGVTASISSTTAAATLTPTVSFHFSQTFPFMGKVTLGISVNGADHIELAAVPQNALTPLYLGNANFISGSGGEWSYTWDTKNVPNGYYSLVARVFNHYGSYETRKDVAVRNVSEIATTTQASSITTTTNGLEHTITSIVHDTAGGVSSTSVATPATTNSISVPTAPPNEVHTVSTTPAPEQTLTTHTPSVTPPDTGIVETSDIKKSNDEFQREAVLNAFKSRFQTALERYGVAVRAEDESAKKLVKDDISADRQQTLTTLKERGMLPDEKYEAASAELDSFIAQGLARIESREKVIQERVGSSVTIDTDKDGIVDYDEVHLYKTNPLSADTDNDGFTDGAEIISGFDPLSPNKEAVKSFEDPVKSGPLREDILLVAKVETEHATTTGRVEARFSGKALPNSFVTLYIFSTPVVVTVKTGDDGSWSYVFDKELEDGSHTVYAGITDNAGRIVAKSNPFPFVKKAEAYSGVVQNEPEAPVVPQSSELLSRNIFLLITALSVILLGLALVALGAYFMRPKEFELTPQEA